MAENWEPFEKIAIIGNLVEAQVVESMLKEQKIPYRIRSFHDTAYDGLFQFQKGWGEIYAPAEQKEEILKMIDLIRTSDAEKEKP
jgi:hypothetical protein